MKQLLLSISLLLIGKFLMGQLPITVAESTFKISGVEETSFYYGFAAGDELVFNFEEVRGKKIKEIEIIEYPNTSRFMDFKAKNIKERKIKIYNSGIYQFRFKNGSVKGKIGKYRIERIPSSEASEKFDTKVYSKTVKDTTYKIRKEPYLKEVKMEAVTIIEPSEHYVNGGMRGLVGGKSRITLPILLPKNTVEWYYEFYTSKDKVGGEGVKKSLNLLSELSFLVDQTGSLGFGIEMLSHLPGSTVCDLYLLDQVNRGGFINKQRFAYNSLGSRENFKSGIVKISGGLPGLYYLGLRNPSTLNGVHIAVEVVAITRKQEWAFREKKIPIVSTKIIRYLKN